MKQALILAGGKGSRLRERIGDLPKPLVDICGTALLERQVLLAKRYGFTDVLLLVNYGAERIVEFCASRSNWGLNLDCVDDGEPRGTAGATLAVLDRLDDEFLVMYGDTMLNVDLGRFQNFHTRHRDAAATLLVHPNDHPQDSDLVELDETGRIVAFYPSPHDPGQYYHNLVSAALYWMRKTRLEPYRKREGLLDFGKDLFPEMLALGEVLIGYNSPEYIKDCGTPKRLDMVCADYLSGRIARSNLDHPQQAVFLDRDGTLVHEVGHLSRIEDLELLDGTTEAIRKLNEAEFRTVVVTNQPVVARGEVSFAELDVMHAKLETLLGQDGAFLDRIYFCPHHPHRGFPGEMVEFKVDCTCRKPKPGMVERACRELNINLAQSWLVGDSLVDIETARKAGVRSILVETGHAGLDYRAQALPDYTLPNLPAAVDFIVEGHTRILQICRALEVAIPSRGFVLIGGLSRCGKSNLASALAEAVRERGGGAVVLNLDRWLRSGNDRGEKVTGRYDLAAFETLLGRLAARSGEVTMSLPYYHKLERRRIEEAETITILQRDVVIVEGTVALMLSNPAPALRLYVEIDESERHRRVLREYVLRGLKEDEAETVYSARKTDETPLVRASAEGATRIREMGRHDWYVGR